MNLPQLYTKTSYSLLKSTLTIKEYVESAKARGYWLSQLLMRMFYMAR